MIRTEGVVVALGASQRGFYSFNRGGTFLFSGGLAGAKVWFYSEYSNLLYLGLVRTLGGDSDSDNRNALLYTSPVPVKLLLQSRYAISGPVTLVYDDGQALASTPISSPVFSSPIGR